jgi:hypothetical protein
MITCFALHADLVADLGLRIELPGPGEADLGLRIRDRLHHLAKLEELDLAGVDVEAGLDLLLLPELLPGRLAHRLLECLDDRVPVDALVLGDLVDLSLERCDVHRLSSRSRGRGRAKSSRVNS